MHRSLRTTDEFGTSPQRSQRHRFGDWNQGMWLLYNLLGHQQQLKEKTDNSRVTVLYRRARLFNRASVHMQIFLALLLSQRARQTGFGNVYQFIHKVPAQANSHCPAQDHRHHTKGIFDTASFQHM